MMQYILSEEEYSALRGDQVKRIHLEQQKLAELCTYIADTMPIHVSWKPDYPPEPWGCRVTIENQGHEHYCDECPVQSICPLSKEWSK